MFEFKLPDLGEGVHEGQVVNVLVKEGDTIAEYQPMLEVETDKAAVEIPSPKGGTVSKVNVEAGQVVKVGQVLIVIDDAGGKASGGGAKAAAAKPEPAKAAGAPAKAPQRAPAVEEEEEEEEQTEAAAPAASRRVPSEGPVAAAPAVRKLARELGVDIGAVNGTGPKGRIIKEDVERYAAQQQHRGSAAASAGATLPAMPQVDGELPDFGQYGPVRREAVPQIRKTIARQMVRAWLSVPRVTHTDTADVTDLEKNRKAYNASLREGEAKLTMTAIIAKVVATALRAHPKVNASYDGRTDEIVYKDYVHLGIAVDTPRGLVVPVLRDADQKSLPEVAADLNQIGENARAVRFEIKDLRGATFTITNYGALGGIFGTPMVNYPEVAILGLGRAKLQPAVYEGQIVPRLIMPLSLSFDHRLVDGADAARFVGDIMAALENPLRLLAL